MLLKMMMLSAIIFMPIIAGCSMFDGIFEKNYSLDSVASFEDDVAELKGIWFFCEKCLNNELCESDDVKQCKNVTIPSRNEALSKAVGRANIEAVRFLVDVAKTNVNGVTGEYKETPLIIAAYYGTQKHQDIAEFLISRGADINKTYPAVGHNALGVANWKHNTDFAKILLKHGAEPSAVIHREESMHLHYDDHQ